MSIQGFKVEDSVLRYDYNFLDNLPNLSDELLISSDSNVKGFRVKVGTSENIEKYDYESLDNIPPIAESIEDIKNAVFIDLLDGITLQPGYIQTGGSWSDSQSANNLEVGTKDFVPVTPGYTLLYNAIYTERPWGAIAFYDENKAMVGARTVLNNLVSHTVCIVPENAIYVRVCFSSKYLKSKYVGYTASQSIISEVIHGSAIHSDLFPFIGSGDLDLKTLLPDKYITIDKGNEANYSGYSATTYLACYGMYKFIATITDGDGLAENWFYDKDQNPIPDSKFALPKTGTVEIEIPSDAYYVRFSNKTAAMNTLKVEWWLAHEVKEIPEQNDIIVNTSDLEQLIVQGRREYRPWNSDTTVPLPLVFSVITDIHGDADNLKRYTEFSKHYSDYIDEKLCLGDMVVSFFSSDITYWDNMENTDDILRTIGNHDVWLSYDRPIQNASKIDAYAKYYTGKTSKWDIIQPSNAETNGLMYYYKDYPSQKLRLVVTDCMYWDSAEKTWFTNVLNDAKTNGYSVLCTSHYNLSKTDLTPIANFYSSDIGSSQLVTNWGASDAIEVVDNFITGGGEFVGWLSGDSHYDYCAVYTHPTSGNKQVTLTLENAWCN